MQYIKFLKIQELLLFNRYIEPNYGVDDNMNRIKNILVTCTLVTFFAGSAFFFPRWLMARFGEGHFISSYLYIYGSGIPFFILGVWLLIRSKALDFRIKGERKWLWFFVLGLTWYLIAHGLWILTAVSFPFKGVVG